MYPPFVALGTPFTTWKLGSATMATPAAFAPLVPTKVEPVSDEANGKIVFLTPGTDRFARNLTTFQFFGIGSDNEQFNVQLWRIRKHLNVSGTIDQWVPELVAELLDLTVNSSLKGDAGEDILDTHFFADTFVTYLGPTPNEPIVFEGKGPITLALDAFGASKWVVLFEDGTTPVTTANVLYGSD